MQHLHKPCELKSESCYVSVPSRPCLSHRSTSPEAVCTACGSSAHAKFLRVDAHINKNRQLHTKSEMKPVIRWNLSMTYDMPLLTRHAHPTVGVYTMGAISTKLSSSIL